MSNSEAPIDQLETICDYIRWGASRFNASELVFGHGTDNAVDEALALLMHVLHLSAPLAPELIQAKLTLDERRAVVAIFTKRINERVPAAYLTETAWFCGLDFYVNRHVLIPRSPIAELIEREFTPWVEEEQVFKILDLCTGSGCIAIACAYHFSGAEVDAADLSIAALQVAKTNIERLDVADRVATIQSDLFTDIKETEYDIIVSNPPYVSRNEFASLPEEYKHEPELGLLAGDEGLAIVARILEQAAAHLADDGILVVEVGNTQLAVQEAFPHMPFTWLEFERGGHGVFLLTKEECQQCSRLIETDNSTGS